MVKINAQFQKYDLGGLFSPGKCVYHDTSGCSEKKRIQRECVLRNNPIMCIFFFNFCTFTLLIDSRAYVPARSIDRLTK